ncbi:hypothetical protein Q8F55_004630 [Vanrija albida]|uniref:BRCT domain-containing protein n=1 Tax=Vanrija albida TaxID=181172 RepID=A0ABR3Q8E0_9TREE
MMSSPSIVAAASAASKTPSSSKRARGPELFGTDSIPREVQMGLGEALRQLLTERHAQSHDGYLGSTCNPYADEELDDAPHLVTSALIKFFAPSGLDAKRIAPQDIFTNPFELTMLVLKSNKVDYTVVATCVTSLFELIQWSPADVEALVHRRVIASKPGKTDWYFAQLIGFTTGFATNRKSECPRWEDLIKRWDLVFETRQKAVKSALYKIAVDDGHRTHLPVAVLKLAKDFIAQRKRQALDLPYLFTEDERAAVVHHMYTALKAGKKVSVAAMAKDIPGRSYQSIQWLVDPTDDPPPRIFDNAGHGFFHVIKGCSKILAHTVKALGRQVVSVGRAVVILAKRDEDGKLPDLKEVGVQYHHPFARILDETFVFDCLREGRFIRELEAYEAKDLARNKRQRRA